MTEQIVEEYFGEYLKKEEPKGNYFEKDIWIEIEHKYGKVTEQNIRKFWNDLLGI